MTISDPYAASPAGTTQPPRPAPYRTHLAHALQGLFGLYLLICLAQAAFFAWSASTLQGWADRPRGYDLATAETLDRWTVLTGVSDLAMLALIGPCFITWLYLAHSGDRMYRPAQRHGSGWAIGGWFVPILNLWRPLQMVNDVRRGALGYDPAEGSGLVGSWWTALLVTGFTARLTVAFLPDGTEGFRRTMASLQDAAVANGVSSLLNAVACGLAIAVVRHVTGLLAQAPTRR